MQTQSQNTGFTRRLYSVHGARPQSAHGAQEEPTSLPQCHHSLQFNTLGKRQAEV